ncbi:MAG: tetratricopeptide repeat protein [Calditrichia bacterium]
MKKFVLLFSMLIIFWGIVGCSGKNPVKPPEEKSYAEFVEDGWNAFQAKDYDAAIAHFLDARDKANQIEAIAGLGWCYLAKGNLANANSVLNEGLSMSGNREEIFSGLAFTRNGMKNFTVSNQFADSLLSAKPNWSFSNGLPLTVLSVYTLKSINYFLLGNFMDSLIWIQKVDGSFNPDISTTEGMATLAQKIESESFVLTGIFAQ